MSKQKIFEVTLNLVEENDLNVSVRQIAKAAEVNVGAVNYHFGSKENLIKEIIRYKLENLTSVFTILEDTEIDKFERLELFICRQIELIKDNPEIADYIMSQEDLFETRYEYQQYLDAIGYQRFEFLIQEITGLIDKEDIIMVVEHVLSACIMSYIKQIELAKQNKKFEADKDYRKKVNFFINNYFYKYRK